MATVLFAAVGTLLGGPLGTALGAMAGRRIDQMILGAPAREGARLTELGVSTSSYGAILPRHFGQVRTPGSIIWSTDLVEHSEKQGSGKGQPAVTSYSYTASFAVALSSRPLRAIGRIWADGNLLRGGAGDLKSGGTLRIHTGHGDQHADPLIAAAEGTDRCPAFRGIAYVVFEDLDLSPFGNRIPALTFEVMADEAFTAERPLTLATLLAADVSDAMASDAISPNAIAPNTMANVPLPGFAGWSLDGPPAELLRLIAPVVPVACCADGEALTLTSALAPAVPITLSPAGMFTASGDPASRTGIQRTRAAAANGAPGGLRYYDIARDYQPGLQIALGRPAQGAFTPLDLPASMTAMDALHAVNRARRHGDTARDAMTWRTSELDPRVGPGSLVLLPGKAGTWRVATWEWSREGVELGLVRSAPDTRSDAGAADSGRAGLAADIIAQPSTLAAFELPWDGHGAPDSHNLYAAVASAQPEGWTGAALFVDHGDGALHPLGPSGRNRSIMGRTLDALAPASPHLIDRRSRLRVRLTGNDMSLTDASPAHMSGGANRALAGEEIIQFANARRQADGTWLLTDLLRGRGGTEHAIADHRPDEPFVLLDGPCVALDAAAIGEGASAQIAAIGRADLEPVRAAIAGRGTSRRPLSPVCARLTEHAHGAATLTWLRRGRGQWAWRDSLEPGLVEPVEAWRVDYGSTSTTVAEWNIAESRLVLSGEQMATLRAAAPEGRFAIRQIGAHGLSRPLLLFA